MTATDQPAAIYADPANLDTVVYEMRRYTLRCVPSVIGHLQVLELPWNAQVSPQAAFRPLLPDIIDAHETFDVFAYVPTNMDPETFKPEKHGFIVYRDGDKIQLAPGTFRFMTVAITPEGESFHVFKIEVDRVTGARVERRR